jgi:hypothetical protein
VVSFDPLTTKPDGTVYGTEFKVTLGDSDFESVKRADVCAKENDCFLAVGESTIKDMSAFGLTTAIKKVDQYVADGDSVKMVKFKELDLNRGTLTIEFTETVDIDTLNPSSVRLAGAFGQDSKFISLNKLTTTSSDAVTVEFTIDPVQLGEIYTNGEVCTSFINCFLRFEASFIKDRSGNEIQAVASSDTFAIAETPENFIPDTTGPRVVSYSLNIKTKEMGLTFDEPVRLNTLVFVLITHQTQS